jgi:hypothetical protein
MYLYLIIIKLKLLNVLNITVCTHHYTFCIITVERDTMENVYETAISKTSPKSLVFLFSKTHLLLKITAWSRRHWVTERTFQVSIPLPLLMAANYSCGFNWTPSSGLWAFMAYSWALHMPSSPMPLYTVYFLYFLKKWNINKNCEKIT